MLVYYVLDPLIYFPIFFYFACIQFVYIYLIYMKVSSSYNIHSDIHTEWFNEKGGGYPNGGRGKQEQKN